jgi:hypothetical protein
LSPRPGMRLWIIPLKCTAFARAARITWEVKLVPRMPALRYDGMGETQGPGRLTRRLKKRQRHIKKAPHLGCSLTTSDCGQTRYRGQAARGSQGAGTAPATDRQPDQRLRPDTPCPGQIAPQLAGVRASPIARDQSWRHAVELVVSLARLRPAAVAALSSMTAIIATGDPETAHRRR